MDPFSASEATILVLDCGPVMRAALEDALESAGFLVITARDLGEAIDRLKETPPDLLIIRPFIDSMPAPIAVANLRSRHHGLPVLLVSGLGTMTALMIRSQSRRSTFFRSCLVARNCWPKSGKYLDLVRSKRRNTDGIRLWIRRVRAPRSKQAPPRAPARESIEFPRA